MNSELQILVISYSFPPDAEVGGKRTARFCQYLPRFGIRPIVLSVQEHYYEALDPTYPVPAATRIVRTWLPPTPLEWYKQWKSRVGVIASAGTQPLTVPQVASRGFVRRQALTALQIPDRYWNWYLPAIQAGEELLRRESISAICSSAPPWTSHLIARYLRKKYRIPWLADFRDPWVSGSSNGLSTWRHRLDCRMEQSCLRWADLVISVTDAMSETFAQRYPALRAAGKIATLTNGFDDLASASSAAVRQSSTSPKSSTRLFLYLGDLYGERRIDTFCQALTRLVHSGKLAAGSFKVLFLGNVDPDIAADVQRFAPELAGSIEFRSRVSWQDAQQVLQDADVLLLFQGNFTLQIPAKFFEYLRTGKPIFAVTREGALSRVVEATASGIWADPTDPGNIATQLLQCLTLPRRPPEAIESEAGRFHYQFLTERLAGWIRDLTARGLAGDESSPPGSGRVLRPRIRPRSAPT